MRDIVERFSHSENERFVFLQHHVEQLREPTNLVLRVVDRHALVHAPRRDHVLDGANEPLNRCKCTSRYPCTTCDAKQERNESHPGEGDAKLMKQRGKRLCCFSNLQPSAVGQALGLDQPSPTLFVCRQCFPGERKGLIRHYLLQLIYIQRAEIFRNTREERGALRTKHAQKECFAAAAFLFEKS